VGEEGRRHQFAVVVLSPQDPDWTARVLAAVERKAWRARPGV
jgi:hypothetical protein